ncbi:MAG: hypothetical protein ABIM89_10370, partial [Mycobacteriales bacterium]
MKRLLVLAAVLALGPLAAPGTASAGGGCHGDYVPDAKGSQVTFSQLCMNPMVTRIPVKGTVTWTNEDELPHNLVGAAYLWGTDGDIRPDESVTFRFSSDGTFPYACTIHAGMLGAVVVGSGIRAADANRHDSPVSLVSVAS